ncbi:MAG: sulfatase-like hydrolase/transferase [Sandaracinaceae bacterium]
MKRPLPPLVPEQLAVGLAASTAMALADGLRAALHPIASSASGTEVLLGTLVLVVLYAPLGVAAGVAMALLTWVGRRSPWMNGIRRRLTAPRTWLDRDPAAFAATVAAALTAGLVALAARQAYLLLAARTHRIDLASWTMAGLAVGILVGAPLVWSLLRLLLRPLARLLGPFACVGGLLIVAAATALTVAGVLLGAYPAVAEAYGLDRLLFAPLAALVLVLAFALVRRWLRRGGPSAAALRVGAALLVAATLGAWLTGGLTYRSSNRVRGVVEQRSILGRTLVRAYATAVDLDGDGHAWAFGGRDCDDFDAEIYPGARDPEGDGIDADCFAGDGSPDVADLGDGAYGTRPSGLPERPNVVLITIDALRPDHLGAAGYRRPVSPTIDRFIGDAVFFEDATAQSARSIRSLPSMLTGRYPSQIAFGPEYLYPTVLPVNETLPEVLRRRGYATAVTMGTGYFTRVGSFFQGFDDVQEIAEYKPERTRTMDRSLAQLRRLSEQGRPFFQWIHLFNVHQPYLRPPAASRFGPEPIDAYDTEIALADAQFRRLLDALGELGLEDRTVVILASDHGEAFGEHGRTGHSSQLYEEQIRATLVVRAPGVPPRFVDGPVALMDVFPTVLNLVGQGVPDDTPSRSLLPLMTGEADPDPSRLLFAELMPDGMFPFDVKMIRQGDEKLIWWVQDGTFQLFDLAADPGERNDLSDQRREDARRLLGLLQAWVAETNRPENRTDDFVARHRLRSPPARMSHPLDVRVPGLFTILGYDLPRTVFRPGDRIPLTFYYRVDGETALDLFFRVNVEGPRGYVVPPHFHALHFPLHGRYPTHRWRRGELLRDAVPMVVPPDIQTPAELWLTLSVQIREAGLMELEHEGGPVYNVRLASFEVVSNRSPAPGARPDDEPAAPPAGRDAMRMAPTEARPPASRSAGVAPGRAPLPLGDRLLPNVLGPGRAPGVISATPERPRWIDEDATPGRAP